MDHTKRFTEILRRPEPEIPLDVTALLIAAHADATIDVEVELGRLDELADGVRTPTLDGLVQ